MKPARLWTKMGAGLLAAVLAGCAGPGLWPPSGPDDTRPAWLISTSTHAGLVLRVDDVAPGALPALDPLPRSRYAEFGWGDADYYPADAPGTGLLLKAALWPTRSVIHVAGFDDPPERFFAGVQVIPIALSRQGLGRLVAFIDETFERDRAGGLAPLGAGLYGRGGFFAARGSYSMCRNCNTWAAAGLRRAGLGVWPSLSLTAPCLRAQVPRAP